jgi:hypothetical protein
VGRNRIRQQTTKAKEGMGAQSDYIAMAWHRVEKQRESKQGNGAASR